MRKTRIFLIGLTGMAIGFAVGMKYATHLSDQTEHTLRIWEQESRADIAVRALRFIRHDSTNTVAFLESNLDNSVAILGILVEKIPESHRTQRDIEMIQIVQHYRAEFPRQPEPPAVSRAFS